jgi:hypothetical protein
MKMLYKQKEVLKLLYKNNIATFNKSSFSEAVSRGQIPYHYEDGVKTKLYDYDEVVEAIKKAGIGKPPSLIEKLDKAPPPKAGQTKEEYGEQIVHELGEKPSVTDANIYKTIYQGKIEKIKYEKLMGELIPREAVENKAFETARAIRDKILTIPERLSNELASISDAHQIKELLFKEFEMLLDGFSEESFYVRES